MKINFNSKQSILVLLIGGTLLFTLWKVSSAVRMESENEAHNEDVIAPVVHSLGRENGETTLTVEESSQQAAGILLSKKTQQSFPDSAHVWWNGSSWVYKAVNSRQFLRCHESELNLNDNFVKIGAQWLLSLEFSNEIKIQED